VAAPRRREAGAPDASDPRFAAQLLEGALRGRRFQLAAALLERQPAAVDNMERCVDSASSVLRFQAFLMLDDALQQRWLCTLKGSCGSSVFADGDTMCGHAALLLAPTSPLCWYFLVPPESAGPPCAWRYSPAPPRRC
jgi:hypothetical protein